MKAYKSKRLAQDKRYKKISMVLLTAIFLALVANLVIFVGYSKFSNIKHFTVTGLNKTELPEEFIELMKAQVHNTRKIRLLGIDNYFAWSEGFSYSNPQYKNLKMEKHFKERTINFFVDLRERYAIWCKREIETTRENCRWIDKEGVAFESAPSTSGQIILSIKENVESANFSANSQITNTQAFKYIEDILNSTISLNIQKQVVFLDRKLQELQINTIGDTKIVFSTRFDPNISAIPALVEFNIHPGLNFFREINLAVEGRAFTTVK